MVRCLTCAALTVYLLVVSVMVLVVSFIFDFCYFFHCCVEKSCLHRMAGIGEFIAAPSEGFLESCTEDPTATNCSQV